jgi:DNA-binding NarL/FixJ family response regulator
MTKTKVAIVDDEILMIKGMKVLLEQEGDIIVTNEATNGRELLDLIISRSLDADIILLDLSMPEMDGVDALKEINRFDEEYKIIVLTSHYNDSLILKMLDEGVSGFLAKNENPEDVINTIRKVAQKGFHINDHVLQLIRQRRFLAKKKNNKESLSKREIEIIEHVCNELSTKEIAEKLFISPRTVEGHRNRILEKTGCKNIAGVVVYAIEHNLFAVNISKFQ